MTGYFKTHRWLVAAVAGFALVFAVACGSSDMASNAISRDDSQTTDGDVANGQVVKSEAYSQGETAPQSGSIGAPSDEAATGGTDASAPGTLPAMLDRKIILTATLSIETDEVSKRFEDVGNIAAANGGFVASSSFGTTDELQSEDGASKPRQTASLTIRVPSENYQRAVVELRKLGEVKDVDTGSNDVTEEYTDLESRLRGLRAVETQYMDFLTRAVTIDDVLTVQDRLNSVRVEMEQVQGRINLFANQTDLATITVHLDPPLIAVTKPSSDGDTTPAEAIADAWEASLAVLIGIATVVLVVVVFSWWLVPVLALAFYFARRFAKSSGGRRAMDAPPSEPAI